MINRGFEFPRRSESAPSRGSWPLALATVALALICGCPARSPSSAVQPTTSSDAAADSLPPPAALGRRHWSCFSWLYHQMHATKCYKTLHECGQGRRQWMLGDRGRCMPGDPPVCVRVDDGRSEDTLCFGRPGFCEDHRSLAQAQGHRVSTCVQMP